MSAGKRVSAEPAASPSPTLDQLHRLYRIISAHPLEDYSKPEFWSRFHSPEMRQLWTTVHTSLGGNVRLFRSMMRDYERSSGDFRVHICDALLHFFPSCCGQYRVPASIPAKTSVCCLNCTKVPSATKPSDSRSEPPRKSHAADATEDRKEIATKRFRFIDLNKMHGLNSMPGIYADMYGKTSGRIEAMARTYRKSPEELAELEERTGDTELVRKILECERRSPWSKLEEAMKSAAAAGTEDSVSVSTARAKSVSD